MVQKILITTLIVILLGTTAKAQEKKVAVFDPAGEVEKYLKEIVREEISSIVVNTPDYTVLERQLIDKVLEENKFQMGGLVDDSQISEIGKRMGANYVFVTNITVIDGGNLYISYKMIDVQTARIEKQKTGQSSKKTNELISTVQKMVKEMFGSTTGNQSNQPKEEPKQVVKPIVPQGMLVAEGKNVFIGAQKLGKSEVRNYMTNTPDALKLYNKGLKSNKNGNVLLGVGIPVLAGGITLVTLGYVLSYDGYYSSGGGYYEEYWVDDSYYDYWGNWIYDGYWDSRWVEGYSRWEEGDYYPEFKIPGWILVGSGIAMITTGIILKSVGKKNIRKSVDAYNNKGSFSNIDLKFGISPNSFKLSLTF